MLSARPQGNLPSYTEVARGQGYEQCKVITTRSRTKANNDAIQVEENEQLSNEEHDTTTSNISISDATTSLHVAASSSLNAKPDEVSKVHINLLLVEAIEQMSNCAKFLKDIVSKRTRLSEFEIVAMTEGCMAMLHNRLPPKLKDPDSFTIPCAIDNHYVGKALCDLGASINLMPKSVFERLGIGKARPTTVMLQLADRSYIQPEGKIEDILHVTLDVFKALKRSDNREECHNVNVIDVELETYWRDHYLTTESEYENSEEQKPNKVAQQEANRVLRQPGKKFKFLDHSSKEISTPKISIEQPHTLRTSPMLEQLEYDHLGNDNTLPITLSFDLQHEQENRLIDTLVQQKEGASLEIHDEIAMTSSKQLLQQGLGGDCSSSSGLEVWSHVIILPTGALPLHLVRSVLGAGISGGGCSTKRTSPSVGARALCFWACEHPGMSTALSVGLGYGADLVVCAGGGCGSAVEVKSGVAAKLA
ncbi:hypothetical protein GQ457_01G018300 [Hibiscus cannabinus]